MGTPRSLVVVVVIVVGFRNEVNAVSVVGAN